MREALGLIDVQLLKRHDLIPSVLRLVEKFMADEKERMKALTGMRVKAEAPYLRDDPESVRRLLEAAGAMQVLFGRLFVVAEKPRTCARATPSSPAQHIFSEVEGHIAAARRFYNPSVTDLNNAIEIFPRRHDRGRGQGPAHALLRGRRRPRR